MSSIWIGTSGWHYKHWLGTFYPPQLPSSRMLAHYVEHFNTVELNNSFYKLPSHESLANWRDSTPPTFHFAAKGSRFLTHMKKLKDAQQGLTRFLDAIEILEPKLGPLLFQLPPGWGADPQRLADFLAILPPNRRSAFEFRNPSWNTKEIFALLGKYNAANCIFDLAGYKSPEVITADWTYIRLHGPGGKYQGTYDDSELRRWARKITAWSEDQTAIYVYFDNDDSGYAPGDALRLKALLGKVG